MYNSFGKYKTISRIQIFLGLYLACCFILCSSSYFTFADQGHSYTKWGSYDDNLPLQEISGNFDITLPDMLLQSFNTSVSNSNELTSLNVSYSNFISCLNYFNLNFLVGNWQPGNPEYFFNLFYTYNQGHYGYVMSFSKHSGSYQSLNPYVLDSSICLNNTEPIYFDNKLLLVLHDYSFLSTSNGYSSQYSNLDRSFRKLGNIIQNTSDSGYWYINGAQVPWVFTYNTDSSTISNRFSEYLNNPLIEIFSVYIPDYLNDSNHINPCYVSNAAYSFSGDWYPIFSLIRTADYYADDVTFHTETAGSFSCYFLTLNRFSTGLYIQDRDDIFSYGYEYGGNAGLPTPTPIPTFLWGTPTPFPNVTFIPATLTPIVVPYDPSVITGTDTFDNLSGYLGILHYYISQPINRFMSTVITCIYSFSDWFKFILVVPIICLFAFIIGRLKRK